MTAPTPTPSPRPGRADPPVLRAAGAGDAEALAALIRLAFAAQSVATDPPPSALNESAESVARHLAEIGGGLVAPDEAEALAAGLLWQEKTGALYIGRLAVHPGRRGRGLARALISAAEQVARTRGLDRLTLSTRLVLADNRRLFAACGFAELGRHAHPGYAHPTFVDLEKRLG